MDIQAFLQSIQIEGNLVRLPEQRLEQSVFQKQVKRPLEKLGGQWSKKFQAFEFPFDPTIRVKGLIAGIRISLRSKYHYFDTDIDLVGSLLHFGEENGVVWHSLPSDARILEPSAGQGNIMKVLHCRGFKNLHYCELMPENREILSMEIDRLNIGADYLGEDFLQLAESKDNSFDMIVANPPFRSELKHLKKMMAVLKPGGLLFSITSPKVYSDDSFHAVMNSKFSVWAIHELHSDSDNPLFEGTDTGCCFLVGKLRETPAVVGAGLERRALCQVGSAANDRIAVEQLSFF